MLEYSRCICKTCKPVKCVASLVTQFFGCFKAIAS